MCVKTCMCSTAVHKMESCALFYNEIHFFLKMVQQCFDVLISYTAWYCYTRTKWIKVPHPLAAYPVLYSVKIYNAIVFSNNETHKMLPNMMCILLSTSPSTVSSIFTLAQASSSSTQSQFFSHAKRYYNFISARV